MELINREWIYENLEIGKGCRKCTHSDECDNAHILPEYTIKDVCNLVSEQNSFIIDTEKLESTKETICDKYCKWTILCTTEDDLHETFCKHCPLNDLTADKLWKEVEQVGGCPNYT